MGAKSLSKRKNWQNQTSKSAKKAENTSISLLRESRENKYNFHVQPMLSFGDWNFKPEVLIVNPKNDKMVVLDNKNGNNGGNAHERSYRYFSPMFLKSPYQPFLLFTGKTFASEEPYYVENKSGKRTRINPEKYRNEFKELIPEENYSILNLDSSNLEEVVAKLDRLLE